MADPYASQVGGLESPGTKSAVITPDDDNDLGTVAKVIYCEEAGDVAFITTGGTTDTWAVAANSYIRLRVARVKATGTTVSAGTLHAIYD